MVRLRKTTFLGSSHRDQRALALRAGRLLGLSGLALWSCSSRIELLPLEQESGEAAAPPQEIVRPVQPEPLGSGGAGQTGEAITPMMLAPAGTSGGAALPAEPVNTPAAGGSAQTDPGAMGGSSGAPPCPDADADGLCDAMDACPNAPDDGNDRDADGIPDACDGCPELAGQDDTRDIDTDGKPDACDACGIGIPLGLSPLFFFPLDETGASATAVNLGSVQQQANYVGPVERGLAGVSDPAGRAARFVGQANGQFSRVLLLNVATFPSTALTATFWIRTQQPGDYSVISYAIAGSSNEFGIIVEDDRIRLTLNTSTFEAADLQRSTITDGTWHFVALTWQGETAQFYFDGVAAGAPLTTAAGFELDEGVALPVTGPLVLRAGGALVFGQDQDSVNGGYSAAQALSGGLDDVAIYDRVLSAEQIRSIFEGTTCGERCDGIDNDADGKVDEGFLGSSPACAAPSCDAIAESSAFGSGDYFSSANPSVPLTCNFF